jgi:hypothetical protein
MSNQILSATITTNTLQETDRNDWEELWKKYHEENSAE